MFNHLMNLFASTLGLAQQPRAKKFALDQIRGTQGDWKHKKSMINCMLWFLHRHCQCSFWEQFSSVIHHFECTLIRIPTSQSSMSELSEKFDFAKPFAVGRQHFQVNCFFLHQVISQKKKKKSFFCITRRHSFNTPREIILQGLN